MKLSKLFPTLILALGMSLSIAACDDGDDGDTTDTNADTNTEADTDEETGTEAEAEGGEDIDCASFCTTYIEMCLQTAEADEFETFEECDAACGAWDQAGTNCRYEQIVADACDQAGNTGSAC